MNLHRSRGTILLATAVVLLFSGRSLFAEVLYKNAQVGGVALYYRVVLPNGYDANKAYPGVLAFPGGPQNMGTVSGTLEGNWRAEAERRGYIVVIPAAPNGQLFFKGGSVVFPEFITKLLSDYKILGNKFHIAGVSNGGISAFYVAAAYPQYFISVTGLPGYLPDPTPERIAAISNMCIYTYVGELDQNWNSRMKEQAEQLRSQGLHVQFSVEEGQPHVMQTLEGPGAARLFDQLEEARKHPCTK
jgi:poly(3-hydroxybutyrate) depolymerase